MYLLIIILRRIENGKEWKSRKIKTKNIHSRVKKLKNELYIVRMIN